MTDKARGSDQLKLDCSSFSELTQDELMQVAGGNKGVDVTADYCLIGQENPGPECPGIRTYYQSGS